MGPIWKGHAKVSKGKEVVVELKKGNAHCRNLFSYRKKTHADAVLERGSLILMWDQEKLRQWISKNLDIAPSFQKLMSSDLVATIWTKSSFSSRAESFF